MLKNGGRPSIEYFITLNIAKELAMVERNEQGKRARQYFIECERRALLGAQASAEAILLVLRFFGKFTPPHE